MKAVGYRTPGPIDRADALQDITLAEPVATGRDLLVRVHSVSVNPIDTKIRTAVQPAPGEWGVLGFDASGVVEQVGPDVRGFAPGDEVFYAGSRDRPGTNSELHLVDERIVGAKPASLTHSAAAALPLTSITAWEMLFDRLDVRRSTVEGADVILVIGGAGGVGSITIQLLRALTDLIVVATASRVETRDWVRECGAHHVIDHRQGLADQVRDLGLGRPGYVFSTTHSGQHLAEVAELIAPQGRFGLIDDPQQLDIRVLKAKAISVHWESMFVRPVFQTPDVEEQSVILNEVSRLVEDGQVRSTATEVAGRIDAATLKAAHARIESGTARGKIVLEGF